VTEIAYSYARGGDAGTGYVPTDSPLTPSRSPTTALGWPSSSLREQYEANERGLGGNTLRKQVTTNEAEIGARQIQQGALPNQTIGNDVAGSLNASEVEEKSKIEAGRAQVSQDAGTLSENYKASVRTEKISPNHGGNQAVWDTVGANAAEPRLGIPPKVKPIGEWHIGKDGSPVAGPEPETIAPPPKP